MIPFMTFDTTLLYKSGAKHTIRYCSKFDIKRQGNGDTTISYELCGRDKIMLASPAEIEAIFYTINPFYKNVYCLLLRLTRGLI